LAGASATGASELAGSSLAPAFRASPFLGTLPTAACEIGSAAGNSGVATDEDGGACCPAALNSAPESNNRAKATKLRLQAKLNLPNSINAPLVEEGSLEV
jgi:hypothetical protein